MDGSLRALDDEITWKTLLLDSFQRAFAREQVIIFGNRKTN
jgi:hypothetical protein